MQPDRGPPQCLIHHDEGPVRQLRGAENDRRGRADPAEDRNAQGKRESEGGQRHASVSKKKNNPGTLAGSFRPISLIIYKLAGVEKMTVKHDNSQALNGVHSSEAGAVLSSQKLIIPEKL